MIAFVHVYWSAPCMCVRVQVSAFVDVYLRLVCVCARV